MFDAPGLQVSNAVTTSAGCRIYFVDLATLGLISGTEPWTGTKRSLRLDPAPDNEPIGGTVQIDWVRLVENQPSLLRNITWSGTGPVDIYLDNDNTTTNNPSQTLGLLAASVNGSSYSLNVGALQPGDYYVAIRPSGTNGNFSYSPGFYRVNAPATIALTSPSDEGSADDFATVHLNNAWDFTSMSDIDHMINVQQTGIVTVPGAETEAGTPLGNITAFSGASTTGEFNAAPCASFAKPAVYPLHSNVRGQTRRIDPTRYRILTAELGLPNKARDICGGSIVRVVWHVAGDASETYSDDIVLNSRLGANVLSRLNMDMATLQIEPGSPSQTGWVPGVSPNPGIMTFRIDPHEFANPTAFFIKRMKLAALDTAHTSFNVPWTTSKTGGTINVYYDIDKDPASKTLIGSANATAQNGSLSWNTSGLPDGAQYFVYVEHNDGTNVNGAYSKWPVVIDHTPASNTRLVLNRSTLNFGVVAQTIKTPSQVLRLSVLNAPAGQPCWTASSDLPFLVVSPVSGCGGALADGQPGQSELPVDRRLRRVDSHLVSRRDQLAAVRPGLRAHQEHVDAALGRGRHAGQWRRRQRVHRGDRLGDRRHRRRAGDDLPQPGGRTRLRRRTPRAAPNQLYVGDAVSIDDARPDIEGFSPTTPLNYRAGWGFLVLTNMLPNQGNGTFNAAHERDRPGRAAWRARVAHHRGAELDRG